MFFSKKITFIKPLDRVLEIGPGASPHPRSDEFLEFAFDTEQERVSQRGDVIVPPRFRGRPVYYYSGDRFPFEDGRFDYVICSHVLEHVADPELFLREIFRVGKGCGYLEYPLIPYEYMYDFDVHRQFIKFDPQSWVLRYLPKTETSLSEFRAVSTLFRRMLQYRWDDLCAANKQVFFEGFEFYRPFAVEKATNISQLTPLEESLVPKKLIRRIVGQVCNRLGL
ncbi:MAG: methyltransferase domain-containing protein [Kiritimatiellales bacterium]